MANKMIPYDYTNIEWLTACAIGEGGRARLCMEGYGNAATAYYFAREAGHYARLLIELGVDSCSPLELP